MEKKFYLINIIDRKHGYSVMVKSSAADEDEALELALDAGVFEDDEDADHAVVEEASQRDIEAFEKVGGVIEID